MEIEWRTAPLEGSSVDCMRFGRGEKHLVLLPGLSFRGLDRTGRTLAHMYRSFGEHYRVTVFDRRAEVPAGYTVADMAADTARAMDALGIGRAAVFGVSQGGMAAQYLALDRPERVEKLVLAVTLSRPNDTARQVIGRWAELAEQGDAAGLAADVMEKMYSPAYLERFGRLLSAAFLNSPPPDLGRYAVLARACLTCEAYGRLDEIRCPALVLGGREDRVLTGRASEEIAEKLGCGLYMYEGLGHAAYEEAGDFNGRVLAFLLQDETGA